MGSFPCFFVALFCDASCLHVCYNTYSAFCNGQGNKINSLNFPHVLSDNEGDSSMGLSFNCNVHRSKWLIVPYCTII